MEWCLWPLNASVDCHRCSFLLCSYSKRREPRTVVAKAGGRGGSESYRLTTTISGCTTTVKNGPVRT